MKKSTFLSELATTLLEGLEVNDPELYQKWRTIAFKQQSFEQRLLFASNTINACLENPNHTEIPFIQDIAKAIKNTKDPDELAAFYERFKVGKYPEELHDNQIANAIRKVERRGKNNYKNTLWYIQPNLDEICQNARTALYAVTALRKKLEDTQTMLEAEDRTTIVRLLNRCTLRRGGMSQPELLELTMADNTLLPFCINNRDPNGIQYDVRSIEYLLNQVLCQYAYRIKQDKYIYNVSSLLREVSKGAQLSADTLHPTLQATLDAIYEHLTDEYIARNNVSVILRNLLLVKIANLTVPDDLICTLCNKIEQSTNPSDVREFLCATYLCANTQQEAKELFMSNSVQLKEDLLRRRTTTEDPNDLEQLVQKHIRRKYKHLHPKFNEVFCVYERDILLTLPYTYEESDHVNFEIDGSKYHNHTQVKDKFRDTVSQKVGIRTIRIDINEQLHTSKRSRFNYCKQIVDSHLKPFKNHGTRK